MEKFIITQTDHGVDVLLNGNRVNCINELTIRYTPKQKPKVEINLDAAAEKIEGYLCTKDLERVVCPKCGRVLVDMTLRVQNVAREWGTVYHHIKIAAA